MLYDYEIVIWVALYCCFGFTVQPYQFHLKSIWWTIAVQLTEVASCHQVRVCCQFYEHNINNYLTGCKRLILSLNAPSQVTLPYEGAGV